jgi:prophage DNA circulation protein
MSWQDRVQPYIVFTAPSGQIFTASWQGDSRSMEKALGIFKYPKIPGAVVQDLDVDADRYPLTFWFDGPDHDFQAELFYQACKQRGPWIVEHPTKGLLTLQLMAVNEDIQPIHSGNVTMFTTDWIATTQNANEPVLSLNEAVREQIDEVLSQSAVQLAATVKLDTPDALTQFRNAIRQVTAMVTRINQTTSVYRGITATLDDAAIDVLSLAGQIQALIYAPSEFTDLATRFTFYADLLGRSIGLAPDSATVGGANSAAMHDLVATTCLTALVQTVADGDMTTREEALNYIDNLTTEFNDATADLDASQELFAGSDIERQYFSQSQSYNDTALLMAQAAALLLRRSFDLAVAKRITLDRHRAPVEIAITENIDLDLFLTANQLKGDDILLLPPGRQVVVYL